MTDAEKKIRTEAEAATEPVLRSSSRAHPRPWNLVPAERDGRTVYELRAGDRLIATVLDEGDATFLRTAANAGHVLALAIWYWGLAEPGKLAKAYEQLCAGPSIDEKKEASK